MKKLSRREFLSGAATMGVIAVAGGSLVACGNSGASSASNETNGVDKVVVGYWGGTCEAPIFVAKEKGYFEEEGLEASVVLLDSGSGASSDAMIATGELDCYELTPDKFKPMEQGLTLKIIDSLHTGCIQGATTAQSGINSIKDLEGKTVAASVGSIAQIMIAAEMVDAGLDPNKVKWVSYKNPLMEDALDKGEIDAFACYDPYVDIAVKNGKKKFWSWTFGETTKDTLCCFVGCNAQTIENKPSVPPKLARAFKKATDFLSKNPEEAAQIIVDGGYVAVNGDNGFTKEIMIQEIKDYQWLSGNKDVLDASFKYIWECIWKAGALDDHKFQTVQELDDYVMGTLYEQEVSIAF